MKAKEIMSTNLVTVSPDNSIRHAAEILLHNEVSGAPVLDGEQNLVGMFTEGDLLRRCELCLPQDAASDLATDGLSAAMALAKAQAWNVAEVMTRNVLTVAGDTSIGDIAALMLKHKIKRLPVVEGSKVVGIVSRRDLLKVITAMPLPPPVVGDDRIRTSVLARLRDSDVLNGELPDVVVHNGMVRLTGACSSDAVRQTIRMIADAVPGARGVDDLMTVKNE
jgi:CBS domain-containing protein